MMLVVHVMALWKQKAAAYSKPLIKSVLTEDLVPDIRNNFVPKIYCKLRYHSCLCTHSLSNWRIKL